LLLHDSMDSIEITMHRIMTNIYMAPTDIKPIRVEEKVVLYCWIHLQEAVPRV